MTLVQYQQLKGAKETTEEVLKNSNVTQLTKDNVLMKIREVILDDAGGEVKVTTPSHITWFPYQVLILLMWIGSSTGLGITVAFISDLDFFQVWTHKDP